MDDTDSLLRELRIDWETLITEDFNPLKQALKNKNSSAEASNFRNLFHKVEKVMESIIERSYKGFSDSVLSYMESYKLNKRCSESILSISEATEDLLAMRIGVKDMAKEYDDAEFFEIKHGLCMILIEIKKCFGEFCSLRDCAEEDMGKSDKSGDVSYKLLEAAKKVGRAYELISENNLTRIECVEKFKEEMDVEVLDFMKLVCKRLDQYIFYNRCEYQEDFRCIVVLNALEDLEKYQIANFEREYFKLVEFTIKNAAKEKKDKQLETLVRILMGKTQMVIRNFNALWEMADIAFEGLRTKTKNFFGEEGTVLRIYSPEGGELVEDIIQRVLEKFILEYTESPEKYFNEESFRVENFIDDIDYGSVFESKYLIHEKMVRATKPQTVSSGCFTKICTPTIETAIFMRRYAFNDPIKKYLEKLLSEKYVEEKVNQVKKKVIYLFNDDEWYRSDYSNSRLSFYSGYEKYISEFSQYPDLCNVSIISDFLSGLIEKKFSEFFEMVFKSQIIKDCFSDELPSEEQQIETFKNLLIVRVIDRNTLFLQKQYYENVLFAIETLKDINGPLKSEKLEGIKSRISAGLRFQVLLEVFYFFDLFYREGNYANKDDYYMHKILRVIEDVYESASKLDTQARSFRLVFECLNFYIQNNVGRLNIKSLEDLKAFNEKVKLLDEILSLIEGRESLKETVNFIDDAISMNNNGENAKKLRARINMKEP